jgi:hypothetical protein
MTRLEDDDTTREQNVNETRDTRNSTDSGVESQSNPGETDMTHTHMIASVTQRFRDPLFLFRQIKYRQRRKRKGRLSFGEGGYYTIACDLLLTHTYCLAIVLKTDRR